MAVTIAGLVNLIAGYHYFRIFGSWEAAYTGFNGSVKPSGGRPSTMPIAMSTGC